jgi:hypothetical protein
MVMYTVFHVHEFPSGDEDIKFIGVFSSRERAQQAISQLSTKPGFCDAQDGFHIDTYEVDSVQWSEGYVDLSSEH